MPKYNRKLQITEQKNHNLAYPKLRLQLQLQLVPCQLTFQILYRISHLPQTTVQLLYTTYTRCCTHDEHTALFPIARLIEFVSSSRSSIFPPQPIALCMIISTASRSLSCQPDVTDYVQTSCFQSSISILYLPSPHHTSILCTWSSQHQNKMQSNDLVHSNPISLTSTVHTYYTKPYCKYDNPNQPTQSQLNLQSTLPP